MKVDFNEEEKREPAWKQPMRDVADNPNFIFQPITGLIIELRQDKPSPAYLREKARLITEWVEEIIKFGVNK